MAAPKSSTRGHPGRALVFITVVIAALYGIMFATGETTPRLGIDLAGGTSVTLEAKPDAGGSRDAINPGNMNTAVQIIRDRVNAFGVSEAEVQTQGENHIVINIPKGTGEKEAVEQVGKTAKLYFRPVLKAESQPYVPPAAAPSTPPATSPPPPAPSSPAPTSAAPSNPAQGQATTTPPAATTSASATGSTKPSTSATAKSTSSSSASSSAKPQGRVIPNLPEATPPPATPPAANPPAAPATTPPPIDMTTSPTQTDGTPVPGVTPTDEEKFAKLNCSDPAQRGIGNTTDPKANLVTCDSEPTEGQIQKYILGPAVIDGTDLDSSQAQLPQGRAGGWEVALKFDGSGTAKFKKITGALATGQYPTNRFAVELDGAVVVAPTVSQELPTGEAVITGDFSRKEAQALSNVLKYGALPLTFTQSEVSTVSAALGSDQLRGGLIAGAIGLFLVALYSIMYYRGLGIVSLVSLLVSALLTYAIMCLLGRGIGFALNLPAVCGAIAAIGITADSFIVYFERIRDEVREGKSLQPAVARAWPRARRTILVSDFVSFLAAAVLYWVSVGKVKGFAFTLGLTTLLDIVVVFLFTKPLMVILARKKFFASGHPWSGLDPARLGAKRPLAYRATRRPRPTVEPKEA